MKFFFCGGSNLDTKFRDIHYNHKFPSIISNHFNAEHINVATSGGSNKRSIRKMFYEYNMEEFDFICVDYVPYARTEFYDDTKKEWIRYNLDFSYNPYELKTYYEVLYNNEYGMLMEKIEFNIIKKYLLALQKPHVIISSRTTKSCDLNFDFHACDYHFRNYHLTICGHKQLAFDIIKKYENILQR